MDKMKLELTLIRYMIYKLVYELMIKPLTLSIRYYRQNAKACEFPSAKTKTLFTIWKNKKWLAPRYGKSKIDMYLHF